MPCADKVANNSALNSARFAAADMDHSHGQSDLCSPFCICNCCGVQVLSYASAITFDFPVLVKTIKCALPSYTSVFASNFCGSIWQPPQIA
ncbi:hypothetical protein AR687_22645 [Flavobacteriaceae bacterium CRH]|nr:hypothetical protein AR687_22645 [Flavobacteriaceae bacterium CRH]